MIKVAVAGCGGRMGSAVGDAVEAAEDMELICGIDPSNPAKEFPVYSSLDEALSRESFEVLVDFTQPDVVAQTLSVALPAGIDCVVGTTGLSDDTLRSLADTAKEGTCLFYAPNFTTGAVLMMEFAKAAAPYFPEAEVLEFHHCNKKDAPSGTAVRTAQLISESRDFQSAAPGKETEIEGAQGARGALIKVFLFTRFALWDMLQVRKWYLAPWVKRSLFVTIHGIALLICQVFYLESVQLKNATVWWLD